MPKTQAQRAREYRQRKRDVVTDSNVTTVTETVTPNVTDMGPLDVYSEHRWQYLQSRGHKWDSALCRSVRPDGVVGVTVPGDPAYDGVVTESWLDGVRKRAEQPGATVQSIGAIV